MTTASLDGESSHKVLLCGALRGALCPLRRVAGRCGTVLANPVIPGVMEQPGQLGQPHGSSLCFSPHPTVSGPPLESP